MSSIKSSKTLTFENENLSINKVVCSYCEQPLLFRWIICFDIRDMILSNNTAAVQLMQTSQATHPTRKIAEIRKSSENESKKSFFFCRVDIRFDVADDVATESHVWPCCRRVTAR